MYRIGRAIHIQVLEVPIGIDSSNVNKDISSTSLVCRVTHPSRLSLAALPHLCVAGETWSRCLRNVNLSGDVA